MAGSYGCTDNTAATSDGTGTAATFYLPGGMDIDPSAGAFLLIADTYNHCVRKVTVSSLPGTTSVWAGTCSLTAQGYADGTGQANIGFYYPRSLAISANSEFVYVLDGISVHMVTMTSAGVCGAWGVERCC